MTHSSLFRRQIFPGNWLHG